MSERQQEVEQRPETASATEAESAPDRAGNGTAPPIVAPDPGTSAHDAAGPTTGAPAEPAPDTPAEPLLGAGSDPAVEPGVVVSTPVPAGPAVVPDGPDSTPRPSDPVPHDDLVTVPAAEVAAAPPPPDAITTPPSTATPPSITPPPSVTPPSITPPSTVTPRPGPRIVPTPPRPRPVPPAARPVIRPAAPAAEPPAAGAPAAAGTASAGAGRPAPAAARAPVAQASPVTSAVTDPRRWGRVDADGTIHVRVADGERAVGSWQAGAPEEGLAHFARRFDDLRTEVELLAARLTAGGGDPKHALSSARTLRDGLDAAAVVGDLDGLRSRLDDVVAEAEAAVGAVRTARDAQRGAAVARKEELAAEAETLAAEASQWKQAGDRFTAILDEWRAIRGIDRKTDEALWKRFSKARESFNRRRGTHFADLDRQRAGARTRKEELVVEAEKLAGSEEWGPTAARFRDLMTEWKAAGRAQKDTDDTLWQRFRGAQDAFFARRSANLAERDAEFVANAEAKKALLGEAEKIGSADPAAARAALRDIQERWEEIGKVPRDDIRPLEARLRAVEEKVRDLADRQWRRSDPEAEARVAQFRDRVAQYEAQAAKARTAGDARRAEQAQQQADQWREWLTTAEQAVQQR